MRFEVTIYGFENRLRDKPLRVLGGDSYVLVGPGKVEVWTADREAARDVIADKGVGLSEMSMSKFSGDGGDGGIGGFAGE